MNALALSLALALTVGGASKVEKRTITKSSVYLVKAPSFLSAPVSKPILRGEKVDVDVPEARGWFVARYKKSSGFIHLSYVADRAVAFKVTRADAATDASISGNYNLAVGGFTETTESNYRKQHPDVEGGFRLLEPFMPARPGPRFAVPSEPDVLARFVQEGHLKTPEANP